MVTSRTRPEIFAPKNRAMTRRSKIREQLESDPNTDPKKLLADLADETTRYLKDY